MKFYYVESGDLSPYYIKLSDAKKDANGVAKESHHDVIVKVVEVPLDKANIQRMLNNSGGHTVYGEIVHTAKARLKRETMR